jgi:nicotinamide mononucleotide transporter
MGEFFEELKIISWQEWVSTLSQIVSVLYARKNNILVYPMGIIGVLLAFWLYIFIASPPLYAEGMLHLYYFGMSLYGWYNWVQKKALGEAAYPISWCSLQELRIGCLLFVSSWLTIYFMLIVLTNSDTPILDSGVSAAAFTGMWWMAKRKIENWLAWIVSNAMAIPLNFYKGFSLFAVMYILFLILAISGFIEWKRMLKEEMAMRPSFRVD